MTPVLRVRSTTPPAPRTPASGGRRGQAGAGGGRCSARGRQRRTRPKPESDARTVSSEHRRSPEPQAKCEHVLEQPIGSWRHRAPSLHALLGEMAFPRGGVFTTPARAASLLERLARRVPTPGTAGSVRDDSVSVLSPAGSSVLSPRTSTTQNRTGESSRATWRPLLFSRVFLGVGVRPGPVVLGAVGQPTTTPARRERAEASQAQGEDTDIRRYCLGRSGCRRPHAPAWLLWRRDGPWERGPPRLRGEQNGLRRRRLR